jgi:AraC family transcriptional regulator
MILHQFPDLDWLKHQSESRFQDRISPYGLALPHQGWPTVILNVDSKITYRDGIRGPVSLFTNIAGESSVSVHGKSVIIKEHSYFISNHDQRYTLEIHPKRTALTFNIHFGEHFTTAVFQSLQQSYSSLIENKFDGNNASVNFYNRLNQRSAILDDLLQEIQLNSPAGMALEEKLFDVMNELLLCEKSFADQINTIEVAKSVTRQEIVKRLTLATDYIQSHFDRDLSLAEVAAASCLSKFHFLRLFKSTFDQTPHQYLNAIRVTRGQALLRRTQIPVIEIAKNLGFENASSFSRMFFTQTGHYPSAYRRHI